MANWSDVHISFEGTEEAISAFYKFLEEDREECKFPVVEREVEIYDDTELTIDGNARWSLDLDEVANFCKTYKLEASGYDAESGSNFFIKFSIDSDGAIDSEDYHYLCRESVDAYGAEYFIEYYTESRDTAEDAEEIYNDLLEAGAIDESEDKWEYIQYFCWKEFSDEKDTAEALKKLKKLKSYGEASGSELVLELDDFYIVETQSVQDNKCKAIVKDKASGLWEEKVLGLEVFKDIAGSNETMINI